MKKQIAIITPGILPVPSTKNGAVETLIEFYLKENESKGEFHFHVFSIYDKKAEIESQTYKYTTFYFFNPNCINIRIKRFIYGKMRKFGYYNTFMDYYGLWAFKVINKISVQIVMIENRQGFIYFSPQEASYSIYLHLHNDTLNVDTNDGKEIIKRFDKIVTVSEYIKNQVDKVLQYPTTSVVYNGIDINRFIQPKLYYQRKDYGLSDNDFVVIYSGRITPIKGIRELIKAFINLKAYTNIKLLLVGAIPTDDNDPFLKEINQNVKMMEGKIISTGFIPYENIPAILHLANVCVIPSICEDGLTLSSIEAMACGLPLIITRSGGIPEAVSEDCAIIIEKNNVGAIPTNLSKAIISLYLNKEKCMAMSKYSVLRSFKFDMKTYTNNILRLFR